MSEFWSRTHPRARVQHRCEMCGRTIDPGEVYLKGYGGDRGDTHGWTECAHCEAMQVRFDIQDGGGYDPDMLYQWARDPQNVTELRAAAGYLMKWRTRAGNLIPVPGKEAA